MSGAMSRGWVDGMPPEFDDEPDYEQPVNAVVCDACGATSGGLGRDAYGTYLCRDCRITSRRAAAGEETR